jgi:hypothetical protein
MTDSVRGWLSFHHEVAVKSYRMAREDRGVATSICAAAFATFLAWIIVIESDGWQPEEEHETDWIDDIRTMKGG